MKTRIALLIAAAMAALCGASVLRAGGDPPAFVLEREVVLTGPLGTQRELQVICDTRNGTLLYIAGTPDTSMVAIPGGCKAPW